MKSGALSVLLVGLCGFRMGKRMASDDSLSIFICKSIKISKLMKATELNGGLQLRNQRFFKGEWSIAHVVPCASSRFSP